MSDVRYDPDSSEMPDGSKIGTWHYDGYFYTPWRLMKPPAPSAYLDQDNGQWVYPEAVEAYYPDWGPFLVDAQEQQDKLRKELDECYKSVTELLKFVQKFAKDIEEDEDGLEKKVAQIAEELEVLREDATGYQQVNL